MEIKVNVINEMKKLRSTAYSDPLSWVDELMQNAQRADASRVDIKVTPEKFEMKDNGVGCNRPEALFEKSTTGWDESVASQNPFGEGFFSTLIVADKITVRSIDFEAVMNIREMFEKNTVECITVKGSPRRSGFAVKLEDLRENYDWFDVKARVRKLAKYMPMNVYLDGERIESNKKFKSVDFHKQDEYGQFAIELDNEYYEGWMAPSEHWRDDLYLYAQRREVKEIWKSGVVGVIHAKEGQLDLRSPDRKDYISNDKSHDFLDQVMEDIKRMWVGVVKNGSDQDLDEFAETIARYLEPEDYQEYLRFVSTDNEELEEILKELRNNKDQEEREKLDKVMEEMGYSDLETEPGEIALDPDYIDETEQASQPEIKEKRGNRLDDLKKNGFYVARAELTEQQEKMSLAQYHGIPVVIAKNVLEIKVLEQIIPHISTMNQKSKLVAKIKNAGPTDGVEKRIMYICKAISRMLEIDEDTFIIGDVTGIKKQIVGDSEQSEEMAGVMALHYDGQIYLDRVSLRTEYMEASDKDRLTEIDRKFICENLETISHELAHLLYHTTDNTKDHEVAQRKITHKILDSLF